MIIGAGVLFNFILYLAFGSLILYGKKKKSSLLQRIVIGFFAYYTLFFFFCVPIMKYYRPLSMLSGIWCAVVAVILLLSLILNLKGWIEDIRDIFGTVKSSKLFFLLFMLLIIVQIILTVCIYNFTLDAAFYVAGVSTNVDTNMINVYDPFTGAWQDHFEMRYFFATYPVQDAVICQLSGISPLIWTKSVMTVTIVILTNMVYYLLAKSLTGNDKKKMLLSLFLIFIFNITFNTIYTASTFLMTRTYEGKAIVGNLALLVIFYIFILMNNSESLKRPWLSLFLVCFGASTISSTANMLVPVEMTVLFLPLIFRKKTYKELAGYILCILPGVILALTYVLYVKGYFVFYTFPK
ncbi:MAG: hypothetical protein K5931_06010 [Lachnospiraceae bacterium]|nr:hypothetical protein [Lachnospiraceae bacterium]